MQVIGGEIKIDQVEGLVRNQSSGILKGKT
jgi:hypothetical protein